MARIRLLQDIQTDIALLKAGREVLCNWPDAVRMERYGLAVIVLNYER
jgi:hypothetical protein